MSDEARNVPEEGMVFFDVDEMALIADYFQKTLRMCHKHGTVQKPCTITNIQDQPDDDFSPDIDRDHLQKVKSIIKKSIQAIKIAMEHNKEKEE